MTSRNKESETGVSLSKLIWHQKSFNWLIHLERPAHTFGLVTLAVFTACQRNPHETNGDPRPVSSEQQTTVLQATGRLRDQWNGAACQAIYEGTPDGFRLQPMSDFLPYCEFERRKLGVWQSFSPQETFIADGQANIVFLEGQAIFATGTYDVIIAWMIHNREPRFLYLSLGQNGRETEKIPRPRQLLVDPPFPLTPKRNS